MSDEQDDVKVEVVSIESLQPDPHNANVGTERGYYMLIDSIQERGAGRGILASREGVILAGNKTHQAAIDTGIRDILLVHTTGDQLVVTVRDDLEADSPEARRLALEDNRIGQVSLEFDPAVLLEIGKEDDTIFEGLFRDDELEKIFSELIANIEFPEYDESIADSVEWHECPECGHKWPK
ncbi:MAG: hypothetical protein KAT00_01360 [Planctomycetes bacterium]|nr:hypothetical protein [Planctomycetota bacterium]